MPTSKKASTFLSTPLSDVVSLSQVPGVGTATFERLARHQILSVQQLLGRFLMLDRDTKAMVQWLHAACSVRRREAMVISEALFAKMERMAVL